MFAMPGAVLAHPRADMAHAQSGSGACWRYHSAPCSCLRLRNDPTPKDEEQKSIKQRHITQRFQLTPFLLFIHRRFTANCLCAWHSRGEPGPATAGAFKGKIGRDGTWGDARCSMSSARASHPWSLGGLRRAWRRSPPEKGLPTLRRAYSSRTDLVSVAERGLLLEAPGGGHAGYDSELIAPPPGNEPPRGN